ncbi:cold-shock protein [Azospirillum sp. SYSU D00513]|uniref:cold-shock protein n=1 Tax=Azospirillum sp. SYSU D00513 TaxID=2812561 RepID=UPI001A96CB2D|nr:cold-shock protein [Azospirillum sp. SYSU D00513]
MNRDTPRSHVYRQPNVLATQVQARVKWFDTNRGFGFVQPVDGSPDALIPGSIVGAAGHDSLPDGATVVVDIIEGRKGNQVGTLHSVDTSTAAPPRQRAERGFGGRDDRGQGDRGGERNYADRGGDRGFGDRGGFGARGFGDRGNDRGGDRGFGGREDRGYGDRGNDRGGDRGGFGAAPRRGADAGPTKEIEGTVKWFNATKGFGFIAPDDGGRDVFVHVRALERSGLSGLDDGQRVRMSVRQGEKGMEAVSVSGL